MAGRMLRRMPLMMNASLVSLPLVQSLLTVLNAHTCCAVRYNNRGYNQGSNLFSGLAPAPFVSRLSPWQSAFHSSSGTQLRRSSFAMSSVPGNLGFTTDAVPSAAAAAAPARDVTPEDVLQYWFKDADLAANKFPMKFWFYGGEDVDNEIKEKFGECLERAIRGEFDHWKSTPLGRVALVLVFDQFSRNCHRETSRGYAQDDDALQIALDSIHQGVDQQISSPVERYFLYMPLMHSESLEVHKEAEVVFQKLVEESKDNPERYEFFQNVVKFLRAHSRVLIQFGRYPSRNAVLGRTSTAEEEAYLARGELWPTDD